MSVDWGCAEEFLTDDKLVFIAATGGDYEFVMATKMSEWEVSFIGFLNISNAESLAWPPCLVFQIFFWSKVLLRKLKLANFRCRLSIQSGSSSTRLPFSNWRQHEATRWSIRSPTSTCECVASLNFCVLVAWFTINRFFTTWRCFFLQSDLTAQRGWFRHAASPKFNAYLLLGFS